MLVATDTGDGSYNQKSDLLLQENRRKMLRRAANRRSAQLSRARKKSHLEELKIENSKLQRLVDILDSQPELVFCITADGRISQITSRSEIFMKTNLSGDGSDEVPTHVDQILSKESVDSLLKTIEQLMVLSPQAQNESNMLFSAKEVYFHDAFGYPLVGSLRCSKVARRTTLQEMQFSEESMMEYSDNVNSKNNVNNQPAKKARVASSSSTTQTQPQITQPKEEFLSIDSKTNLEGWNFSNFKLLTEAVSTMVGDDPLDNTSIPNASISMANSSNGLDTRIYGNRITSKSSSKSSTRSGGAKATDTSPTPNEELFEGQEDAEEVEFVCVIRTSDDCFAPHSSSTNLNSNLLMFSSQLSTASMVAHDLEQRVTSNGQKKRTQSGDDSEENSESNNSNSSSNDSSGVQPNSDNSSQQQRHSTSSETCSEENLESVSETNST